jgi:predicted nucleic acid-binding protein
MDAGPVIHLALIDSLFLLQKFNSIHIPTSVIKEIKSVSGIAAWPNVSVVKSIKRADEEAEQAIKRFRLHVGESDVIRLARMHSPSVVLTDDLDAGNACEQIGIEVHGSVGAIAYAFHKKWITLATAEHCLTSLQSGGNLFISSAIIEDVIRELRG